MIAGILRRMRLQDDIIMEMIKIYRFIKLNSVSYMLSYNA